MIAAPPQQSRWVCWLQVIAFSLFIFVSIPFARALRDFVDEHLDRSIFHYVVVAAVAYGLFASARTLHRVKLQSRFQVVWLLLVAGAFTTYAFALDASPEEAFHLVEYGALSVLIFRALTHHVRDSGIYISGAMLGVVVGALDEAIQWITPDRVWDIRDIWLNAVGVSLSQLGIALGLRPRYIRGWPTPRSQQWMARTTALAALVVGLSMLNTPDRIRSYSWAIPGMGSLDDGQRLMMQYGYRYEDPDIGVFRSRFPPDALSAIDHSETATHARILRQYARGEDYGAFLDKYTATEAPFVHELRVHLFRRNHYLRETERYPDDADLVRNAMTIAFRENQIVETYFSRTVQAASALLSAERIESIRKQADLSAAYESPVSHRLFTTATEPQVRTGLVALLVLLFVWDRRQARR